MNYSLRYKETDKMLKKTAKFPSMREAQDALEDLPTELRKLLYVKKAKV